MMSRKNIKQAVVVGSGQMGPGIAYTLASVGCRVSIYARTLESVERGMDRCRTVVETLREAECISDEEASHILQNLSGTTQLEPAVALADLVVESIAEDLGIKQKLIKSQ